MRPSRRRLIRHDRRQLAAGWSGWLHGRRCGAGARRAGVIEVGLVGGLTAAGIPQSAAVAAALIERAVTAYLPLIWGWATLVWMRHREYI